MDILGWYEEKVIVPLGNVFGAMLGVTSREWLRILLSVLVWSASLLTLILIDIRVFNNTMWTIPLYGIHGYTMSGIIMCGNKVAAMKDDSDQTAKG